MRFRSNALRNQAARFRIGNRSANATANKSVCARGSVLDFWVEHLDVVEHVLGCLFARPVDLAPDSFTLEQIEEALCHGVVVAVPASAHRTLKIVVL